MILIQSRPLTSSQRFYVKNKRSLSKDRPEKSLLKSHHRARGRNCYGRVTSRHRGGGHKQLYRIIDFKRDKIDIPAEVLNIQYDPFRSADIALLLYQDGEKRYIICPKTLKIGDEVLTTDKAVESYPPGLSLLLKDIPPSTFIHCLELERGKGAQLARAAGQSARLISADKRHATVKLASGEIRLIHPLCRATIGRVGNESHADVSFGKAGRRRWLGKRPHVRGMAMNPVDHPNGGGEGRSKSGGGRQHPMSPWSQLSRGKPTRSKRKDSNRLILVRRDGRKMKRK